MERSFQELELYTIPSNSSWFSWNNIHEVERFSLREFFDGSSITRSPRIYKEYRDFIISKFRENPFTKLTFTDVRKSLVGDISVLHKVFTFLEKWGLINFNVAGTNNEKTGSVKTAPFRCEEGYEGRVKVEEGAPYGVRVVAAPNSMKPIMAPPPPNYVAAAAGFIEENEFKWAPLASYSDVYGELMQPEKKGLVCGICKENCDYEDTKERKFFLCEKCLKSGNYENKAVDDFKLKTSVDQGVVWTEAETLLLLESVLKHGDDWDLVAKNIETKSKQDCISKLIQLPFGDLMFEAAPKKAKSLDCNGDNNNFEHWVFSSSEPQESVKAGDPKNNEVTSNDQQNCDSNNSEQVGFASTEPQESVKEEDRNHNEDPSHKELTNNDEQNEDTENEELPPKRLCTGLTSDVGGSLMKQVSRISAMLGPQVAASAAEAAVTALCYDNQCSKELFADDSYDYTKSSPETSDQKRAAAEVDTNAVERVEQNQSEIQGASPPKNIIPLNLRTRAATATALGAAAANAKLLAGQEEREMGQLVADMIEAQVNKLREKIKYFEDLEVIMEKERAQLEELEESLVANRLNVLQTVFSTGINKPKELAMLKHQTDAAVQLT